MQSRGSQSHGAALGGLASPTGRLKLLRQFVQPTRRLHCFDIKRGAATRRPGQREAIEQAARAYDGLAGKLTRIAERLKLTG